MKTVFITGASSGIGRALADYYLKKNWRVLVCARRISELEQFKKECSKPENLEIFKIDVTQAKDFEQVSNWLKQNQSQLDGVIANAGFAVSGSFLKLTNEDYQRQLDTNFFGVLNTIRPFINELAETKGFIGIVGSVNGYVSLMRTSAYSASKFAIKAIADSLRIELAPQKIGVTLICPGFIETEIRQVNNQGVFNPKAKEFIPSWLMMKSEQAAREIYRGLECRQKELWVTLHGKIIILLEKFLPSLAHWIKKVAKI